MQEEQATVDGLMQLIDESLSYAPDRGAGPEMLPADTTAIINYATRLAEQGKGQAGGLQASAAQALSESEIIAMACEEGAVDSDSPAWIRVCQTLSARATKPEGRALSNVGKKPTAPDVKSLGHKLDRIGSQFTSHPASRGLDQIEEAGALMLEASRALSDGGEELRAAAIERALHRLVTAYHSPSFKYGFDVLWDAARQALARSTQAAPACADAAQRLDDFLAEFNDENQEILIRYMLDHIVPRLKVAINVEEPQHMAIDRASTQPGEHDGTT